MMSGLVLIAEGDPFNLRLLEALCEESGFDIVTAGDGDTALNVIARQRPSLIVLDAELTTSDGADVLEVLQMDACLARIPVLLTTAADDEEQRKRGLELGAADYVARPYRVFEVEQRIRNLLRLAAAERAASVAQDPLVPGLEDGTDPITHAGGPARARITAEYEATRAVRFGHPLTCLILRVTNFEDIVVGAGEETGHGLLIQLATGLRESIRGIDHLFRSDADEFTVLLPETTRDNARAVIDRLREEHAARRLTGPAIEPDAIIAIGLASIDGVAITDGEALILAARAALASL